MTAAQTAAKVSVPVEGTFDPDIAHLVCCDDDLGHVALCGTDVRDLPWGGGPEETDCVVCVDLSNVGVCPRYGRCG